MEVNHLKTIFKYSLIVILTMSLRTVALMPILEQDDISLRYEEVEMVSDNENYKKPKFNNQKLNEIVNSYIDDNSCMNLEYSIFKIDDSKVNVYLSCGYPKNVIFDNSSNDIVEFKTLIKSEDEFKKSVVKLLNLKYPTFVTEEVSVLDGAYDIHDNELIGYFNTQNYGQVSIKINNNEIKNNMTYKMSYDETYENEKYTLDKEKKTIAFTFDDGPSKIDLEIIDTLVNSHSTATFFVVGNRINNFQDSIFKMIDNKMEVGNHTYDHKAMTKLSKTRMLEEVTKTNEIFNELTGKEIKLFRPSYGSINKSVLLTTNMPAILWSIDTMDWKSRNADKVYEEIINNVKDGDIVLMHSLYQSTSDAVKKVIPELYKKGYQIVSVSELFELKGKSIEAGKRYIAVR